MSMWVNLKVLNAAENRIGELPDIGACVNLEEVTLTGNELISLPEGFANCVNLKILHLGRNHLKNDALPLLNGMTKLEELCLFKNKFSVIPPEFQESRQLKQFNISN